MLLKGAYCVGEHFVDPHGYNGSHIIYSNGLGIAFMNVHVVLDSYRFITFLYLTPGVSTFFLTTVSKG